MVNRIRNYVLVALAIGAFYFLLSHHFIFSSYRDIDVLKKADLTFKYTFVSIKQVRPEVILRVESLRDAGLGEMMVERGMLSEGRLTMILDKIESESEAEQ
jgi:hypothetical protein